MEDNKLIRKCQLGDKKAFQELINKYHPFVYKFLIKITQDEDIAQDMTQETFLKIIRNIEKFDVHKKTKFSTYIITISKNCYIDYLRKEKNFLQNTYVKENIDIEDINTNIEKFIIDKLYSKTVIKELNKLSKEQKLVIKMKYIEGLTLKEIGEKLELEPKTIKSRIHNGITKLRKTFKRRDKYEGNH